MFVMMNAARIHVGLQGLGHAEAAYQNARRYAGERLQMHAVSEPSVIATAYATRASPIAFHPAVRRTLATSRALVEGGRALAYWAAHLLDIAQYHPSEDRRKRASELTPLLTPIVKAFLTENGFSVSSASLQIWGGYGYIHEFGIEQSVRDSRIAMIYEGTNEIQAIDLLVRKVVADDGERFDLLLECIRGEARQCSLGGETRGFGAALEVVCADLRDAARAVILHSTHRPELAHNVAADFLRAAGLCLLAGLWARAARVAASCEPMTPFYRSKLETAHYFFNYVLPEADYRLALIKRGGQHLPWTSHD
jgi:Acyl-CoA dehydrogenase, C-terminal domain/Acetyl-CoA dehydrogenase C-terminal like